MLLSLQILIDVAESENAESETNIDIAESEHAEPETIIDV